MYLKTKNSLSNARMHTRKKENRQMLIGRRKENEYLATSSLRTVAIDNPIKPRL